MNIAEQISAHRLKLDEIKGRRSEIMERAGEEARTLDDDESSEYESLKTEMEAVEKHLARLAELEADQATTAEPVEKQTTVSIAPQVHVKRHDPEDKFAGQSFTRRVIARAISRMHDGEITPGEVAAQRWGKTHPNLVRIIKAGVAGGGTESGDWGTELVGIDARYTGDFIEYLANKTVYDQLPLREVPANVSIKGQDGIGTGYWVGEHGGIPVSAQSFTSVNLTPLKVAAISVMSNELIRESSPAAESLVRDGLAEAVAQRTDVTFLSTAAAVSDVSPAGLLNGISSLGSNGYTADAVRQDIKELYAPFISANNTGGLMFVMNPSLAKSLQLVRNSLGQREFPDINTEGGTLEGDGVVTGDNVNSAHMILLKPSDIFRIGDMGIEVSFSRDATIEQDTTPSGDTGGPTAASNNLVSMFQEESTAIKIVRCTNFAKRRSTAVQYVADAYYGDSTSTTA